jgi:hypothetical protein
VFVEAHTVGQDDWTTLPDLNGHTSTSTGDSCPEGWRELHPFLDHFQTLNADNTCSPTGTTGSWNADSGSSGGWVQWAVDLSAYAGKQVEVSIAYVSDWSVQGLGTFVDDIVVSTGEGTTSFETGMDGWTVTGPPPGSARTRTTSSAPPRADSLRARRSRPKTRSTSGSASRGSRRLPRGTPSWAERSTTCSSSRTEQDDGGKPQLATSPQRRSLPHPLAVSP